VCKTFEARNGIHYERGLYSDLKIDFVYMYIFRARIFTALDDAFLRRVMYTGSLPYIRVYRVTLLTIFPVAKRYLQSPETLCQIFSDT